MDLSTCRSSLTSSILFCHPVISCSSSPFAVFAAFFAFDTGRGAPFPRRCRTPPVSFFVFSPPRPIATLSLSLSLSLFVCLCCRFFSGIFFFFQCPRCRTPTGVGELFSFSFMLRLCPCVSVRVSRVRMQGARERGTEGVLCRRHTPEPKPKDSSSAPACLLLGGGVARAP